MLDQKLDLHNFSLTDIFILFVYWLPDFLSFLYVLQLKSLSWITKKIVSKCLSSKFKGFLLVHFPNFYFASLNGSYVCWKSSTGQSESSPSLCSLTVQESVPNQRSMRARVFSELLGASPTLNSSIYSCFSKYLTSLRASGFFFLGPWMFSCTSLLTFSCPQVHIGQKSPCSIPPCPGTALLSWASSPLPKLIHCSCQHSESALWCRNQSLR